MNLFIRDWKRCHRRRSLHTHTHTAKPSKIIIRTTNMISIDNNMITTKTIKAPRNDTASCKGLFLIVIRLRRTPATTVARAVLILSIIRSIGKSSNQPARWLLITGVLRMHLGSELDVKNTTAYAAGSLAGKLNCNTLLTVRCRKTIPRRVRGYF